MIVTGAPAVPTEDVRVHTGVIDDAHYRVEVPPNWNGKLLLYNHGIYPQGYVPEQIELANRAEAKPVLLGEGYAPERRATPSASVASGRAAAVRGP